MTLSTGPTLQMSWVYSRDDLLQAQRVARKAGRRASLRVLAVEAVLLVMGALLRSDLLMTMAGAGLGASGVVFLMCTPRLVVARVMKQQPLFQLPHTAELNELGVTVRTDLESTFRPWHAIRSVQETKSVYLLQVSTAKGR